MKGKKGDATSEFVKWFSELSNKDVGVAGGKGASLAEMYNNKFPIPPGYIITAQAYQYFIEKTNLKEKIIELLSNLDVEDTEILNLASKKIREMFAHAKMPKELEDAIVESYDILDVDKHEISKAGRGAMEILKMGHEPPFVAVRSSATTEDLETASFAGQQESFLNVKGNRELVQKVKECFGSLFTARAIYYRQKKGFAQDKAYLATVVQRMIDSEKSGVIFSENPVKKDKSIVIEAVWGLGEGIVLGKIKPDYYLISGELAKFEILEIKIPDKNIAIVRNSAGKNEIVKLREEKSKSQVLTNYEIKRLAQYAKQLEKHYGNPQDIEFAIEGNEIYIVQSRPITTKFSEKIEGEITNKILLSGLGASPGIASGTVKIIHDMEELGKIKKGDILVTQMTNPDMVVAMQKSAGIVTDEGGLTSHASIVSREMGIPAVVGTNDATKKLFEGQIITVDGNTGKIFEGKAETKLAEVYPIVPTKMKIKVIVDLPDFAQRAAKSGVSGVGLVRLEGIIASSGKHPIKYVREKKIEDYVFVLVEGLRKIAQPFEEIWIRSSDIRSDEFKNLDGAPKEVEGNPMLGNHGIRFSLKNPEIMKAELAAIKAIAEEFPLKKIGLMAPQIISADEVRKIKEFALEIGVPGNVKIGVMVETPAAVQIIDSLCEEGIKFASFGTNDLTQYVLAIDRNNTEVQDLYNEMNPAVLRSISNVINTCKKYGVETSICGQAGSREDMVRFLISEGIDSISVNADAAYKISKLVAELECPKNEAGDLRINAEKEVQEESQLETGQEINVPNIQPWAGEKDVLEKAALQSLFGDSKDIIRDKIDDKSLERDVEKNIEKIENYERQDIEDFILRELEKVDYSPGDVDKKKDIPKLNDAIPLESENFKDYKQKEMKKIGFDKWSDNLGEEWNGEEVQSQ